MHTAWDLAGGTATYVVLAVISLALLAVTSHRLAAPHRRVHPGTRLTGAPARVSR